jgi:hypothetical protein
MADVKRLAGTMSATIDGKSYLVVGEGTYRVSGAKRETLMGQDGYHGYSESPVAGMMSWNGRDGSDVAIAALSNAANATVVFNLANGKTIMGRNMVRTGDGPIEVKTEDATFPVQFEGPDVSEI